MNVGIKGPQDCGKSLLMIGTALELLRYGGYSPFEVVANLTLYNIPGYTRLLNEEMKDYILRLCRDKLRHKIILVDEIDGVFPHRFWSRPGQTEALLGLWQDIKLFNWVIYTCHLGLAVDKLLREVTQFVLLPRFYDKFSDTIPFTIINGLDLVVSSDTLFPASSVFKYYDRWEAIV